MAEQTSSGSNLDRLIDLRRRYLGPLAGGLVLLRAMVTLAWLAVAVPYQWDLSFPEAAVVARAADVSRGESPYHDWREWPHAFAPYSPLTYVVPGLAARIAGDDDHSGARTAGRVLSFLSILGILALIFVLSRRLDLRGAWPWLAAAAALSWESLYGYVISFRPDAPQVFLAFLAFAIVARREIRAWHAAIALVLLTVSFWFKAASFGLLAATLIAIAVSQRKYIPLCVAAFVISNAILFFAVNAATEGRLALNVIGSLDNGIELSNYARLPSQVSKTALLLFAGGLAAALLALARKWGDERHRLLAWASLLSGVFAAAAYMKVGADINYLLEPFLLFSMLAVAGLESVWRAATARPVPLREVFLSGAVVPAAVILSIPMLTGARSDLQTSIRRWKPLEIERRVQEEPYILSVIPYLGLESRGPHAVLDHYQYAVLARRGLLDTAPLLDRIRDQTFSVVVIEGTLENPGEAYYTPQFMETLRARYRHRETYGALSLLVPK